MIVFLNRNNTLSMLVCSSHNHKNCSEALVYKVTPIVLGVMMMPII